VEEGIAEADATENHKKEAKRRARERYLAVVLLSAADRFCAGRQLMK